MFNIDIEVAKERMKDLQEQARTERLAQAFKEKKARTFWSLLTRFLSTKK